MRGEPTVENSSFRPLTTRARAQTIGARVDEQHLLRAIRGTRDEHVVEPQIAVRDTTAMQRRERLEDAADHRLGLVDVHRPGARDARRKRLRFGESMDHDVAIADQPSAELIGQPRVRDACDQARHGQVSLQPALIAGGLSAQHLQPVLGAVFARDVRDGEPAFAEFPHDDVRAEIAARLQLFVENDPRHA